MAEVLRFKEIFSARAGQKNTNIYADEAVPIFLPENFILRQK